MTFRQTCCTAAGLVMVATAVGDEPPRFSGAVDVTRLVVDVRVLDRAGDPVDDLVAADFRVELDGTPCAVESATWVAPPTPIADPAVPASRPPTTGLAVDSASAHGRTVVILVQTGWHRSRLTGMFRVAHRTDLLLGAFTPDDRVALAVFRSHLDIRHDFTSRAELLSPLLEVPALLRDPEPPRPVVSGPSLVDLVPAERARRAASLEQALEVLGDALRSIEGPKEILLVGWGLGRFTSDGVILDHDYRQAFEALANSRTSVFALDFTDAWSHSLAAGLEAAAADTGGAYVKMADFPSAAISRVGRMLGGRWELAIVVDEPSDRGWYELDVEVTRARTSVLAPPVVVARPGSGTPAD